MDEELSMRTATAASVPTLLQELRHGLQDLYGSRLCGLYLYGSYARGEQDPGSDVDVIIVLQSLADYGEEIDRTAPLISDLSLSYDLSVSRVFVSEADWLSRQSPFLSTVRRESVAA
jgi:predicted nucleotidyltransferase